MSIVTTSANYWISPTALNITRNALGEPNRIQASIASGAVIVCYVRGVEGLEYDNGHNYRRWPLAIAPTYFNSNSEKYVYVAIPKSNQIGTSAMVIFPSQKIDIEGYTIVRKPILDKDGKMHDSAGNETTDADKAVSEESQGQRIVPENHFYVWLQGILSSSGDNGTTEREWLQEIQTGTLSTDEALDTRDTSWYTWNPITQTVTFLKEIWMDTAAVFNNLRAKVLILNGHSLKGVAVRGETPSDSDDTIVTPAYLDDIDASKYLRKDQDDRTEYSLGIGGNLNVDGNTNIGGNLNVDGDETVNGTLFANQSVRTDEIRSSNYTGDTIADTGYLLTAGQANGLGHSKLTIDEIYVRMKAVFESLEVRKWSVVAGDEIRSCAANIINRVDYFTDTGELLGYSQVRVPWMAKRVPFLLRKFGMSQSGWGRYIYSKLIRMRITLSNDGLSRVRYCRCYFLANDGDTEIENWWQANDLVRCQTMNVTVTNRQTYTSIVRKQGNVFWWRKCLRVSKNGVAPSENPDIINCQPAIIDEKTYHWFDVAFDGSLEFDPLTGEMTGRTDGNWMAGSDLPAAGDHAVQFGNTTIPGRMNLWITMVNGGSSRDYDPDGDAPCIKGFAGIYTFDLTKCYTGGHPCKMTLAPGKKYHFYGRDFRIITEYGVEPVPVPRGEWTEIPFEQDEYKYRKTYTDDLIDDAAGTHTRSDRHSLDYARKCYWNDEVSHKGCLWLCSLADGSHWKAESAFTHNGTTYAVGSLVPPGVYSALSNENQARCRSCQNYTTDEPNSTSGSWTKLVDRGTSIKNVESRYQKKSRLKHNSTLNRDEIDETAGTVPPNLPWEQWKMESQIGQLQMKDGDYFWTCTKTEYSDTLAPTYEYKVSRWGIDSDGITVNAYFLGLRNTEARVTTANDNYKMPGTSGWSSAEVQAKWFDTFDEMAQANGGVGAMQGWNVWTKTVIRYDADENRAYDEQRADVVNYACTRIGQDGQIAQEEYYMLAASDDFNIVFGSATPNYTQCGIRWYNQSDPAKERYRLSSTTPNINTSIWTPNRPTYNKAVHGSRVYLWNFEYRVDGQGTPYATRPVCIGNHARGIMGVRELYACSAYGQPQTGRKFPNDIYDYSSSHPYTDPNVWTDEIYDRAPSEALPYQWNWTRTLYSSPRDASDTQRDAATGYFYEDIYHVSSVRGTKGEDGAGTEYIYCRTKTSTAPTGHNGTTGTANGTSISGTATVNGTTYNKCRTVDDFVPTGWTDNPVGISHDYPYEWVCERKSTSYSGTGEFSGGHIWGEFSTPQIRSKWGYNGVDGDGVEYVFMRTKNDVPPTFAANDGGNSTDYKSQEWLPYINNKGTGSGQANAESNRCTDDPKGTTRDWPYEWVAKRTMGDPSTATANMGHRDWKSYYESMTDHKMSKWANYAENSIRLDLDNEMDMVQTDSAGKVMAARTVETVVHFYDGAREVKLATGDITASGATKTASGNGVKLSWTYNAGSTFTGAEITVSYTYPAVGTTYTAVFTIAPSMGQPVYQLSPKLSAIIFSRTSTNTLTPASLALGLGIVKIDGGSTTELSSVPSGYTVRWAYDTMPTSNTGGNGWTSGNVATIESSTANSSVCIVLFYGSVVIDRETVPIVKDGENGSNADTPVAAYQWNQSPTVAPSLPSRGQWNNGWSRTAPNRDAEGWFLWMTQSTMHTAKNGTQTYDDWSAAVRISGDTGSPGEDGDEREWIYSYSNTGYNGTTGHIGGSANGNVTNKNQADWVPNGWCDNPQGVSDTNKTEYASWRDITNNGTTKTYGAFHEPIIWSHYGERGMDGDGVEYVFMRTKNDVPPTFAANDGGNSTDYKSQEWLPYINNKGTGSGQANAESNRCTDDPKGTTRDWPYEWVAKRTMGDPSTATANMGHRDWKSYYESMTDHKMSKWANYAENSIRLDLDNEMDMVQTDSAGKVMAARTVETVVHFYDGAREVKLATGDITASGATKTASGNGVKLSWTYNAGSTFTGAEITVSYTYPAVGTTYTAVFTIAPSMGQPVYQLSPKLSAIIFSRTSTNTLTPASLALGLGIVKIDGGSTTELSSVPSGYTVRWAYDTMPTSNTGGNGWTSGNVATIESSTANSSVCIVLFYGSVVIDRETVPIVKDGENGDGIESVTRTYARSTQSTSTNDSTAPTGIDTSIGTNGWSTNSPAVTETYPYLWAREIVTYKYKTATTKYYMIGARGTNGVDGKDGYTILVTPANHIIKQPETSPYTIGSTQLANAYSTISVKRGDTDVSFTIKSVIGTNCTAQKQGNSQVKITEIKTNNGQYYDQGYVTVVITINGKDYTVRINFYCNLLGTWKQSVENGVETIVAKKVTYTLTGEEDTDIETAKNEFDSYRDAVKSVQTWKEQKETTYNGYASQISSANTQINNANTSISQLRTTVNGHTDSISSIEQTSEAIKMGVYNGWDEIVLYKDVRSSVRANYGTTEGRASEAYSSYYDKLGSADIPSGSYYIEVSYEIMIGSSANDGSVSLSMYYNNGYDDDTFTIKVGDVKSGAYVARKEYLRKNYKIQRFDSFELYNGLIDSNKQYTVYAYIRNLKIAVVSDSDGALAKTGIDIEKGVIRLTSANTEMSGNLKVKGNYFVNFSVINSKTFADYVTISGSKYIINLSATGNNVQLGQFTSSSGQFDTSVQELNICLPAITSDMVGMEINICNMYTVNGTPRGFLISSNGANASMYELKTGISTKTSTTLPFGYTKKFIAVAFAGVISGVSCAWVEQD